MNRVEILLDVLEANGFPSLRSKMRERESELMMGATIRSILSKDEIKVVKTALDELMIPSPTGWADAMYVHEMREDDAGFSENRVYDYSELCNLCTTLSDAGLADPEIWRKLEAAKKSLERYARRPGGDSG